MTSWIERIVFVSSASIAVALLACGVAQDAELPLPPTCTVQPEAVRVQLCPHWPLAVVCTNTAQTNFAPGLCDGPDWTEGRQETGNAWCCDERATPAEIEQHRAEARDFAERCPNGYYDAVNDREICE